MSDIGKAGCNESHLRDVITAQKQELKKFVKESLAYDAQALACLHAIHQQEDEIRELKAENERLRAVLGAARALIFSDAATLIRGRGADLAAKSEAAIFLRELTTAVHAFDEAKGGGQ